MVTIDGKTISIYCTYHDPVLVEKYGLNNLPEIYSLYYTKGNHENSLDCIQEFVNEFTTQYFVYKNNIKTDYVGFCQYSRRPQIKFDDFFKNNGIAIGYNWGEDSWANFEKIRFNDVITEDIETYIKRNYKKNDRIYKYFVTNKSVMVPFYINELYLCKWCYFEELMKFLCGFVEYINTEYELNWDPQEWHYYILDNFIDKKLTVGIPENETWWMEKNGRNFWRVFGNVLELLIGCYFGHLTLEMNLPRHKIIDGKLPS